MATIFRFDTKEELARAAAERFADLARQSIDTRGRFVVALSGGSTPVLMYRLLRHMDVDWSRVHAFWSDDRLVPTSDPESNQGTAERELLSAVPIGEIHGIYGPGSPDEIASDYERTVISALGSNPEFDLVLLGMGPDGHTASMFPGDPSASERQRFVVASRAPIGVADRITFTIPLIGAARCVMILIAGRNKEDAWRRVEEGQDLPITHVLKVDPDVYLCSS